MILCLIALLGITALGIWSVNFNGERLLIYVISLVALTLGSFGLIIYAIVIPFYVGAEYKAGIINREFGTSYTQEEIFYASDVIETIRKIKRIRSESELNISIKEQK